MCNLYILLTITFWIASIEARSVFSGNTHRSDVKHFESKLDTTTGYWSPSTSSIDWCERNYVVTQYIAEFWNCISSLVMSLLAGILLVRGLYNNFEKRFLFLCLSFGIVGFGSAYFHGTLTHFGQMADELPMVYSIIIWWYILFRMDKFNKAQDKPYAIDLAIVFGILYGILWTYLHSLQTFVIIFQVHFTLMVIGGIAKLIFLYRETQHYTSSIKYLIVTYISLLFPAIICWIIDQQLCERMNSKDGFNPQLHAWWHLICAIDSHIGIVCGEAMRLLSIKYEQHRIKSANTVVKPFKPEDHLHIVFYFGLPFLDYSGNKPMQRTKQQ